MLPLVSPVLCDNVFQKQLILDILPKGIFAGSSYIPAYLSETSAEKSLHAAANRLGRKPGK